MQYLQQFIIAFAHFWMILSPKIEVSWTTNFKIVSTKNFKAKLNKTQSDNGHGKIIYISTLCTIEPSSGINDDEMEWYFTTRINGINIVILTMSIFRLSFILFYASAW